jgi:hypothetical protein
MNILQRLLLAAKCAPLPPPPSDARIVELALRAIEAEAEFLAGGRAPPPDRPTCLHAFDAMGSHGRDDAIDWRVGAGARALLGMSVLEFEAARTEIAAYNAALLAQGRIDDALRSEYNQALDDYLEATGRKRRYEKQTPEQRTANAAVIAAAGPAPAVAS